MIKVVMLIVGCQIWNEWISFLEGMQEEERKKYEEELEAMKKKHKEHQPVS